MLQIGAALFYYKLGQTLLLVGANVVTNWGSFSKLRQLLLRNRGAIINWGKMYYKLGQVLQIRLIITNWGITSAKPRSFNVMTNGRNFFDQKVKNNLGACDNIQIIVPGQAYDYTTICLLD